MPIRSSEAFQEVEQLLRTRSTARQESKETALGGNGTRWNLMGWIYIYITTVITLPNSLLLVTLTNFLKQVSSEAFKLQRKLLESSQHRIGAVWTRRWGCASAPESHHYPTDAFEQGDGRTIGFYFFEFWLELIFYHWPLYSPFKQIMIEEMIETVFS